MEALNTPTASPTAPTRRPVLELVVVEPPSTTDGAHPHEGVLRVRVEGGESDDRGRERVCDIYARHWPHPLGSIVSGARFLCRCEESDGADQDLVVVGGRPRCISSSIVLCLQSMANHDPAIRDIVTEV